MNKIVIFALVFLVGCFVTPINKTDDKVIININRQYIKDRLSGKDLRGPLPGEMGLIALPLEALVKKVNIYVYPEGLMNYKQHIRWGRNTIYVPHGLLQKSYWLNVDISGGVKGSFKIEVDPGQKEIVLRTE